MTELGIVFLVLPVIESVTVKSAVLVIELVTAIFVLYGIELGVQIRERFIINIIQHSNVMIRYILII